MFALKIFVSTALLVTIANARYIQEHPRFPPSFDGVVVTYPEFDEENPFVEHDYEYYHPGYLASARVRRQTQGSVSVNSKGGVGLGVKIPMAGNDENTLSALGSYTLNNKMHEASRGAGIALDNVNGHSLSVMKESIPGYGDSLTGAGKLNLFHNDNHNVAANAFVTRNMPKIPDVPNYNTVGGGVGYMYKDKVGASLGMASTPFLHQKEYSAMGNLNLFKTPTSSIDLNAGYRKFDSPFMRSNWEPNFGMTFSHAFPNRW